MSIIWLLNRVMAICFCQQYFLFFLLLPRQFVVNSLQTKRIILLFKTVKIQKINGWTNGISTKDHENGHFYRLILISFDVRKIHFEYCLFFVRKMHFSFNFRLSFMILYFSFLFYWHLQWQILNFGFFLLIFNFNFFRPTDSEKRKR